MGRPAFAEARADLSESLINTLRAEHVAEVASLPPYRMPNGFAKRDFVSKTASLSGEPQQAGEVLANGGVFSLKDRLAIADKVIFVAEECVGGAKACLYAIHIMDRVGFAASMKRYGTDYDGMPRLNPRNISGELSYGEACAVKVGPWTYTYGSQLDFKGRREVLKMIVNSAGVLYRLSTERMSQTVTIMSEKQPQQDRLDGR